MTHPSVQGLRETLIQTVDTYKSAHPSSAWSVIDVVLANQAEYLAEYGVLFRADGLVRADAYGTTARPWERTYRLVPVEES